MGVEIIEDNSGEFGELMSAALERALEKIGMTAERHAKAMTPVDTGRLRNSITHEVESGEKAVYVGTNVEYGPYIELGHRNYPGANGGRGFLRPAATEHADEYRRIVEAELKG